MDVTNITLVAVMTVSIVKPIIICLVENVFREPEKFSIVTLIPQMMINVPAVFKDIGYSLMPITNYVYLSFLIVYKDLIVSLMLELFYRLSLVMSVKRIIF